MEKDVESENNYEGIPPAQDDVAFESTSATAGRQPGQLGQGQSGQGPLGQPGQSGLSGQTVTQMEDFQTFDATSDKTNNNIKDAKEEKQKSKKERRLRRSENMSRAWSIAVIVILVLVGILAIVGVVSIVDFVKRYKGKMDTPQEAGQTLVSVVSAGDYEHYQRLLGSKEASAEDRAIFESLAEKLKQNEASMVSNFILIRLENGNQYICSIFFDKKAGEYVLRSVQQVPLEMQHLFTSE